MYEGKWKSCRCHLLLTIHLNISTHQGKIGSFVVINKYEQDENIFKPQIEWNENRETVRKMKQQRQKKFASLWCSFARLLTFTDIQIHYEQRIDCICLKLAEHLFHRNWNAVVHSEIRDKTFAADIYNNNGQKCGTKRWSGLIESNIITWKAAYMQKGGYLKWAQINISHIHTRIWWQFWRWNS